MINHNNEQTIRSKNRTIPSLIKWTGSKRSQAKHIFEIVPPYQRYLEPFVGSGALLYMAAVHESIASDIYRPLIELWKLIQCSPDEVIENYRIQSTELNAELDNLYLGNIDRNEHLPAYYYKVRTRFNQTSDPLDLNFIMRTCVNGIVRFNSQGEFNNSFHLSRRGMKPDKFEKIVRSWQKAIKGVNFICQDYSLTLDSAKKGDFIYLDPPYAGNKNRYIKDLDLVQFFTNLDKLNSKGINWALSFDGHRGDLNLIHDVPDFLYKRHILLSSGNSAINKVLNNSVDDVKESLYLNY